MASIRRLDGALTSDDTREFTYHLMNDKLFLPDVYHDYGRLMDEYSHTMSVCCQPYALVVGNKLGERDGFGSAAAPKQAEASAL